MRSSRTLLPVLALLVAGEAAAQSTLNVVTVPPGAGVVIPPRGAGPRLVARPPSVAVVPSAPTMRPDTGMGLAAPALGAFILPAIAAAVLGGSLAGGSRGATTGTSGPARTR